MERPLSCYCSQVHFDPGWRVGRAGRAGGNRKVAKVETAIGTWNVRTLKACGKAEVLVQEMDRLNWNILGISEMRWKCIGEGTTEEGHKIWYIGDEKKHERGVGFLVNKNTENAVLEFTPISDRIAAIKVAGKPLIVQLAISRES
eukprot:gene6996-biopygen8422